MLTFKLEKDVEANQRRWCIHLSTAFPLQIRLPPRLLRVPQVLKVMEQVHNVPTVWHISTFNYDGDNEDRQTDIFGKCPRYGQTRRPRKFCVEKLQRVGMRSDQRTKHCRKGDDKQKEPTEKRFEYEGSERRSFEGENKMDGPISLSSMFENFVI